MITKIVTCCKIELSSGKKLFFTDYDQNIDFEGGEYIAGGYFTPNSIISSSELAQDNFIISGIIDNDFITRSNLLNDDFTNAYLEVFLIDLNKDVSEKTILKTGWLGEIKFSNNSFTIEISSLSAKTNNLIGKCYSSSCRAEFGDKSCKKKIEDYTVLGEVTSVLENNRFVDINRDEPDDYFNKGVLIFTSGSYKDKKYNVLSFYNKTIILNPHINLKLQQGDKYKIIAGCDKSLDTCIKRFNNAINFRGEPYIPGRHKLLACG